MTPAAQSRDAQSRKVDEKNLNPIYANEQTHTKTKEKQKNCNFLILLYGNSVALAHYDHDVCTFLLLSPKRQKERERGLLK